MTSNTLQSSVQAVPLGAPRDPAEGLIHVVDQLVEILASELAQRASIRQDPIGIRQPLEDGYEQLIAEVGIQGGEILGQGSMPISSRKSARIVAGSGSSSMVNAALQPRCAVLDSPYRGPTQATVTISSVGGRSALRVTSIQPSAARSRMAMTISGSSSGGRRRCFHR